MNQVFIPAEIIKLKRDGKILTDGQIKRFIDGFTDGSLPEYQMSALLMAIFYKGMSEKETFALMQTMLHSGTVLALRSISKYKVDKHSTGGVGDKTSLIIAPIVAAAGLAVPMISGRGLGHTGGTLDKLESIPGFNTQLDVHRFEQLVKDCGLCFIGQTPEICPADKKLYALRDVTGTVESIPLICASIMSKKLAEGIDGLVLDVKYGSGAFMKTFEQAKDLAQRLKSLGQLSGKQTVAFITNMNQPLGKAVGNSLEVEECLEVLRGQGPSDLIELSLALAGQMLVLGHKAQDLPGGIKLAREVLNSGKALEAFEKIVHLQGGRIKDLPRAKLQYEIKSENDGLVELIDTEGIGMACITLGGGRLKTTDVIDPGVGIVIEKKVGDRVKRGEVLAVVYASDKAQQQAAVGRILEAYRFSLQKFEAEPLIKAII